MIDLDELHKLGIEIKTNKTSGEARAQCPDCLAIGKCDTPLTVNLDSGAYLCHRCGKEGYVGGKNNKYSNLEGFEKIEPKKKTYIKPKEPENYTLLQEHIEWFKNRGISHKTIDALKIYSKEIHIINNTTQEYTNKQSIVFPYFEGEELINNKYRTLDKEFKFESNAETIPFNINSIKGEKECIITEGEIDAISFIEVGIPYAISVPNGAGTNLSCFERFKPDYFDDKQTIVLALDNDESGLRLKEKLKNYFPEEKLKIMYYSKGIKDANEELTTNGKDTLIERYNKAAPYCIIFD